MSDFNDKINEAEIWITKFKEGIELYPSIYKTYDEFKKYKEIIDQVPENETTLKLTLESKLIEPITSFVNSLGPSVSINQNDLSYSGATASSGSIYIIDEIQKYTPIDNSWLPKYKNEVYKTIEGIQKEKASIEFIQKTFDDLHPPLGTEFGELVELHLGYISSIEFASSFGIKMRNLIEHFRGVCSKGAIIEKYGYFKELKDPLTWNKISEFAALEGKGSKYDNEFSKNSSIYTDLHGSLSKDAKDYEVNDIEKLPKAFIKTIQYLESSIKLIDLQKIKNAL
jgi:hypothetical protein